MYLNWKVKFDIGVSCNYYNVNIQCQNYGLQVCYIITGTDSTCNSYLLITFRKLFFSFLIELSIFLMPGPFNADYTLMDSYFIGNYTTSQYYHINSGKIIVFYDHCWYKIEKPSYWYLCVLVYLPVRTALHYGKAFYKVKIRYMYL